MAAKTFTNLGAILGEILRAVLSQLVIPILYIVLFGDNTVDGAVIPLTMSSAISWASFCFSCRTSALSDSSVRAVFWPVF